MYEHLIFSIHRAALCSLAYLLLFDNETLIRHMNHLSCKNFSHRLVIWDMRATSIWYGGPKSSQSTVQWTPKCCKHITQHGGVVPCRKRCPRLFKGNWINSLEHVEAKQVASKPCHTSWQRRPKWRPGGIRYQWWDSAGAGRIPGRIFFIKCLTICVDIKCY